MQTAFRRAVLAALLAAFACSLCFAGQDRKDPIEARRIAFLAAFNRGDATALESIFEPDAILLTFTGQVFANAKGIAMGMAGMSKEIDIDLKPIRMRRSGDLAFEAGTWSHLKKGTKEVKQFGTFVWVWKKEKDDWRIDTLSVTESPRDAEMKSGGG